MNHPSEIFDGYSEMGNLTLNSTTIWFVCSCLFEFFFEQVFFLRQCTILSCLGMWLYLHCMYASLFVVFMQPLCQSHPCRTCCHKGSLFLISFHLTRRELFFTRSRHLFKASNVFLSHRRESCQNSCFGVDQTFCQFLVNNCSVNLECHLYCVVSHLFCPRTKWHLG